MPDRIRYLLEEFRVVRRACHLDLLLFLHRHPRMLLPCGERLVTFSGYRPEQIGGALENLIDAGLLERRQSRSRGVCRYVLLRDGERGERLDSLLAIASTRGGRSEVLQALAPGCAPEEAAPEIGPPRTKRSRGSHA
ncbi:MAG: hypothetical protein ABR599_00995 [Gemmatimonadota bacterium]